MNNEPAFPTSQNLYGGMSLLDYFAAEAMNAALITLGSSGEYNVNMIARDCFNMAEAMMAERERRIEVEIE